MLIICIVAGLQNSYCKNCMWLHVLKWPTKTVAHGIVLLWAGRHSDCKVWNACGTIHESLFHLLTLQKLILLGVVNKNMMGLYLRNFMSLYGSVWLVSVKFDVLFRFQFRATCVWSTSINATVWAKRDGRLVMVWPPDKAIPWYVVLWLGPILLTWINFNPSVNK